MILDTGAILRVDQAELETVSSVAASHGLLLLTGPSGQVIPREGGKVIVLNGVNRGVEGTLKSINQGNVCHCCVCAGRYECMRRRYI